MKLKHIFITTYNKRLYDNYAKRLIETYQQTNQQIPLYVFAHTDVIKKNRRKQRKIARCPWVSRKKQGWGPSPAFL